VKKQKEMIKVARSGNFQLLFFGYLSFNFEIRNCFKFKYPYKNFDNKGGGFFNDFIFWYTDANNPGRIIIAVILIKELVLHKFSY
jgi:hypothetical protein